MNLLITGASGFIGSVLREQLVTSGDHQVFSAPRGASLAAWLAARGTGKTLPPDWRKVIEGMDVVVHAAARVHRKRGLNRARARAAYQRDNTLGTLNLAVQAADAGVRRFVFISTVKVNGESTEPGRPFRSDDPPAPVDPYAASKRDAEVGLQAIAAETGMECVIVRPPVVYGPGVKANFLRLMQWIDRGVPLPFAGVDNRRSLVFLGNLVDFLVRCVDHPAAAGEIFMVSDGDSLSTEDLIRRLARDIGRPARLFGFPQSMSRWLQRPSRPGMRTRLFCSLEVDASPARDLLGWQPPFTTDEGLAKTVQWYREWGDQGSAATGFPDA